jgi:hypothetical protein
MKTIEGGKGNGWRNLSVRQTVIRQSLIGRPPFMVSRPTFDTEPLSSSHIRDASHLENRLGNKESLVLKPDISWPCSH